MLNYETNITGRARERSVVLQSEATAVEPQEGQEMQFAFGHTEIVVNVPTWDALNSELRKRFSTRRGFALATINLDHLVKLRNDKAFRKAYAQHDLIVADGNPIVWLSHLAKRPVELIPGSDLIEPVAKLAAQMNIPIAFFGSDAAVLEIAAAELQKRHPGLDVAIRIAPPMGFDPTGIAAMHLLDEIVGSGAGLCFVALGAPKQERFAAFGRARAPAMGFISIGAGLDFLAGRQTRAPRIVRTFALEWVWRMMLDPRRLALRYLQCIRILPIEIMAALRLRRPPT